MNRLPISDATLSEQLARITFRFIHQAYRASPYTWPSHRAFLLAFAEQMHVDGLTTLEVWVRAYHRQLCKGYTTVQARDLFVDAARRGLSWRHVVYPEYKRGRPDPRVTNRGVGSRGSVEGNER